MTAQKDEWMSAAHRFAEFLDGQGDGERANLVRLVVNRLTSPQAYVTVVGETSTGKSSLVNALLSEDLLPVSGKPTTDVVTHVACRDEAAPRFFAVYRDATQEEVDRTRFIEQSLDPDDEVLRMQVRARPKAPQNVGMHIFDTPGYNAVMSRHDEMLMTFLPQSDVIIFVVGYRSGFGQVDQDLFEVVSEATAHDPNLPVVLVINRAPKECTPDDKRVTEITNHAQDAFKRPLSVLIIRSASRPAPKAPFECRALEASHLWDEVRGYAFKPELLEAVEAKLEAALLAMVGEADAALDREEAVLNANAEQREKIAAQKAVASKARADSLKEIDATIARLETALPRLITKLTDAATQRIEVEIMASEKWLGYADCAQWISGHCLPLEVRQIGRAIENHVSVEMEDLNMRLEDIANTAIAELDKVVEVNAGDPVGKFTKSLAATLTQRLAGDVTNSMLRGLGGVGGSAAGAGNLAKMMVARVGRLFGKRFGREVYNQIGRIFSKKMLERLNVALTVIVEVASFIWESQVWQRELRGQCRSSLDEWHNRVETDLHDEHLPNIRQGNYEIIEALYGDLDGQPVPKTSSDQGITKVQSSREQLARLRTALNA